MQTAILSIVYDSGKGHTAQLAALPAHRPETPQTVVRLMDVDEAKNNPASHPGLMAQCNNGAAIRSPHPGNALTAELFANQRRFNSKT